MKPAPSMIACVLALSSIGQGQVNSALSSTHSDRGVSVPAGNTCPRVQLQPTPLEAFARLPATHVDWSREVGRIDSTEARAIITALILADTAQPSDQMRGIRIDLSSRDSQDDVYLGEETLNAYKNALDEISTYAAREHSQGTLRSGVTPGGTAYLGARVFWYGDTCPSVHALDAAYYSAPHSSGLSLSAFKQAGFRFPDQDPSQLSAAIARAIDQLKIH
jgi:hypothetical protein